MPYVVSLTIVGWDIVIKILMYNFIMPRPMANHVTSCKFAHVHSHPLSFITKLTLKCDIMSIHLGDAAW